MTEIAESENGPQAAGRRKLMLGLAGLVAAAAGAGAAWWRTHAQGGADSANQPPTGFWDLQWDTPQGGKVQMQSFRGKPLLINFWATWCPPCIEELPLINDFFQKNSANGTQVLGLAIDRPDAVQGFLQKIPLKFPVGLAGANGSELAGQLGNPSGALPYSLLIGADGSILQRRLGKLSHSDLDAWAQLK